MRKPRTLLEKQKRNQRERRKRADLAARGLTERGTPYRNALYRPELYGLHGPDRDRARARLEWRSRTGKKYAIGLTSRGTPRKYARYSLGLAAMSPNEILWRAFRAEGEI